MKNTMLQNIFICVAFKCLWCLGLSANYCLPSKGAKDLSVPHWQQQIYEARNWPLAARVLYLLCKLKAGELFITEVSNDFMDTDDVLTWFRGLLIYCIYSIWQWEGLCLLWGYRPLVKLKYFFLPMMSLRSMFWMELLKIWLGIIQMLHPAAY